MFSHLGITSPQFTPTAFLSRSLSIQGRNSANRASHNFNSGSWFINGKTDEKIRIYLISVKYVTIWTCNEDTAASQNPPNSLMKTGDSLILTI
jgi:hypothetical protein